MSRSKSSAAADRAVKATTSRHISLFWPPVIWIALWAVAEGTYLLFHYVLPEYLPWVTFGTTVCAFVVCGAGWWMGAARIESKRDERGLRGRI